MIHPFEVGQNYGKAQIAAFLGGGNIQSGVLYGATHPDLVAIFTGGSHSTAPGYPDHWTSDGTFLYCGQGSKGDQKMAGANAIIADTKRTVLVFEAQKKAGPGKQENQFKGPFVVTGYKVENGVGARKSDKLIIFSLTPTVIATNLPEDGPPVVKESLGELREQAILAGKDFQLKGCSKTEYRVRSRQVHNYVLARANGVCECCSRPAPFIKASDNSPYLETHHTRRLADDGPDDIHHVAGICANCHRQAHFGQNIGGFKDELEIKIQTKEA